MRTFMMGTHIFAGVRYRAIDMSRFGIAGECIPATAPLATGRAMGKVTRFVVTEKNIAAQ